jgi:hypothetical protein
MVVGRKRVDRFAELPGWDLVSHGLEDLDSGRVSIEAALVLSASRELGRLGFHVTPWAGVRVELYDLVAAAVGEAAAHSRYNALRRRLASFIRAASRASTC